VSERDDRKKRGEWNGRMKEREKETVGVRGERREWERKSERGRERKREARGRVRSNRFSRIGNVQIRDSESLDRTRNQ